MKHGNQIAEKTVKTGNVGEEYEVTRPAISKYTKTGEEPITRAGVYELGNIDVKFIYKSAGKEVYTKVENEGENGATQNSVNVLFNNARTQRDYGVKIITKDENGNVINGGEFKINKNGELLRQGRVTGGSFYVGKIAVTEEGKLEYEVEQTKATIGYRKIENIIGIGIDATWNEEQKKFEITIDKVTTPEVTASINENDEIVIEVTNEKYKDMYEIEIINKTKTQLVTGGKFKVIKENKTIIEDYAKNGKLYVGGFEISEEGKETYTIYETETAEGYVKVINNERPGIVEVTKIFNDEKNGYDIKVKCNDIPGFTAEIGENGKITVYVETDLIPEDKYDLSMKKFVSEIDGVKTLDREPKINITEEGKIEYIQNEEMEKASNEQEVTYTLRMYNESNVTGKGKRIIEYIPDGLVYLPENEKNIEYGWKLFKQDAEGDLIETQEINETTVLVSDYLVDKEIDGFDIEKNEEPSHLDIKIVFEIDEDRITSEDRILENKVKIEENENDDNKDNDETTEKIYVKYFDLDITKYIKEVKVKNSVKETTQEIGEDKKGQLVKIDVAKDEVKNTTIAVTYGLRVKNIGEIEGYATELVDYIPEDFKLVEDGIWKVNEEGNKAVTTKLENKLLKPGESTTIEITFEWKLAEDNIGSRINEGKITAYENPYNAKDPTEDNNDKEEMLVEVRTGSMLVFIAVAVLVGLWLIVGIVLVLQKRNKANQ